MSASRRRPRQTTVFPGEGRRPSPGNPRGGQACQKNRRVLCFAPRFPELLTRWSRILISGGVKAIVGGASGAARAIIVNHITRQLTMQNTATKFANLSAVRNLASSARQPDFKTLWKTSIFQRMAYHRIFSTACSKLCTSKSVRSLQTIGLRPDGALISVARITLSSSEGYRFCFPMGGKISTRLNRTSREAWLISS